MILSSEIMDFLKIINKVVLDLYLFLFFKNKSLEIVSTSRSGEVK